jgi:hypothetical protein
MRTHLFFVFCGIGMFSLAPARSARAAGPPTPSREATVMTDKARQLYEEGVAAFKKGKTLEAHASFVAAWALNRHWQIAANLADSELELGKFREAAEHAVYYQQHAPADRQDKAKALVNRARARVGALTIDVDPPGAEVLVDDVPVGRAPIQEAVFVDPGAHKVTARFAGRADATQTVTLSAGGEQKVALRMVVEAPPPPVVVPVEKRPVWPAVVTGVLAVGGLAVGAGLTVAANGKGSEADALGAKLGGPSTCTQTPGDMTCKTVKDDLRSRDVLSKAALAGFVVGGALALSTAGLGIWAGARPREERSGTKQAVRIVPLVGSGVGGVVALGVW